MSLETAFRTLTDPRRKQGQRTALSDVLSMVVISYSCGHFTYRKVANFCRAHSAVLTSELGLKHPTPSYGTIREVLTRTDKTELIAAFNKWASTFVELSENEFVSGDGKSLCSTVTNAQDAQQDFQSIVSFFCHQKGMVRLLETYKNKKESEITIVENMIKTLKDKALILLLDALHIQKKQ